MSDEADLLPLIAGGDARAFGRWVALAEQSVRRSLRPFATLCDTEAVLQEAFLRVWQVAPRFTPDGRPNALLRFTVTTARNVALSQVRRSGPRASELQTLDEALGQLPVAEPITADPWLRAKVGECREKLPRQPALALEQRLESGGGHDDATLAARVGMSLNTFLQNFTRARRFLAECLKKAGIDLDAELSP
jgi:RNA polymerase sigma-70 factor (ECF subfamily)